MLTEEGLQAIRERAEKATQEPWDYDGDAVVEKHSGGDEWVCQTFSKQEEAFPNATNNGEFIAHARLDVIRLCDEVERLHRQDLCSVCGAQPLASGRPCVCDGIGTADAERMGLRKLVFEHEDSLSRLRTERDELKQRLKDHIEQQEKAMAADGPASKCAAHHRGAIAAYKFILSELSGGVESEGEEQ